MNSNLKLKRDEIQRGKVAVRVNFVALPPLEIAPSTHCPFTGALSVRFHFNDISLARRIHGIVNVWFPPFPREKSIHMSEWENFYVKDIREIFSFKFLDEFPKHTFKLKTIVLID